MENLLANNVTRNMADIKEVSVLTLDGNMFYTATQKVTCIEILWFPETSIRQGSEQFQWNEICVMNNV
jgi:hypothetical protein